MDRSPDATVPGKTKRARLASQRNRIQLQIGGEGIRQVHMLRRRFDSRPNTGKAQFIRTQQEPRRDQAMPGDEHSDQQSKHRGYRMCAPEFPPSWDARLKFDTHRSAPLASRSADRRPFVKR
jgi:hypothetical protein